jgi:hypothetical protein
MGNVDLATMSFPIGAAVFSAGWASCWTIVVLPMKQRVDALEKKINEIGEKKDERIAALERHMGLPGS